MSNSKRTKKLSKVLFFTTVAAMIVMLVACGTPLAKISFTGGSTFDGAAPDGGIYAAGDVIVMPECSMVREGYVFRGWSDGTNVYQPGDSYTVGKESVNFTALWAAAKLSVRFQNYDGSVLWETTVDYGSGLQWGYEGEEPVPPKAEEGSLYLWDESDGWEPSIPDSFTKDTVFTAKFELVKKNYIYRFYNSEGAKYEEFYGNYGDAMKSPAVPPVKSVPTTEVHVESYKFIGWKLDGEEDSEARLPDENGSIGIVSGEMNFYPVYQKVLKIYTLSLSETPEGAKVSVSGGVNVGGSFQITVELDAEFNRSKPNVKVEFSGTSSSVALTDCGNGVWKGVVENIVGNGIVRIYDVKKNVYKSALKSSHAKVNGLLSEYSHGDTAEFTVVPEEHYSNTVPTVSVNGKPIPGKKKINDGKVSYNYTLTVTDDVTIEVVTTINLYIVSFVNGDGAVEFHEFEATSIVTLPKDSKKGSTAEYDYFFVNWKEKDGKLPGEYNGGYKLPVLGDYTFVSNFTEERRSYSVCFRLFGENEKSVSVVYGKTLSEVLSALSEFLGKDCKETIVESEFTYVFDRWTDKNTNLTIGEDTVVTGELTLVANYRKEKTQYRVTYRYASGGETIVEEKDVPYGTSFGALKEELPATDDRNDEGKYPVWMSDGKEISDSFEICTNVTIEVVYRTYVYTVDFYNEKGELVPEWTVKVEWGNPAEEPSVVKEWMDAKNVYTFVRWSSEFDSVKENLTVRPEYEAVPRVYQATFKNEEGATFVEIQGEKTYGSKLKFKLSLDDRIDASAVVVFADGTVLSADGDGFYSVVISGDVDIYLEGVGTKKLRVTIPESETYTVEAVDSVVVEYGKSFRFRVVNGAAYSDAVPEVTVNGVAITPIDGVYTVENVKENVMVEIPNLPRNSYSVEWTQGEGIASILAEENTVLYDGTVVFTVTLDSGYDKAGLLYETQSKNINVSNVGNVYTVSISFIKENLTIRFYGEVNRYTVALVGEHFIAETDSATVSHGEEFSVAFTVEEFYGHALPTVSDPRAVIEKRADGTYRLSIERVTENMTITVMPSWNVYEVDILVDGGIALDGSAKREIRHGDTIEIEFALLAGYDRLPPNIVVSDGPEVNLVRTKNGWKFALSSVRDITVSIVGNINVYSVTLPKEAEQVRGEYVVNGAESATHGSDYEFSVTLSASNNQTPPKVILDDGTVLTAVSKENETYRYRITAVSEDYIVSVQTRLNEYTVNFVYPDGTETFKTVTHYQTVSAPEVKTMQFNGQDTYADYITGWKNGSETLPLDFADQAVTQNVTYTATSKTRYFAAKIGTEKYLYVETALENATEGDTIELLKPGTDAAIELGSGKTVSFDRYGEKKEYEVKSGVTLKLPYQENAYSNFASGDKTRYNTSAVTAFADTDPNLLYFVLRLPADYVLNLYGTMEIGGIVSQPGTGIQGHTSGNYAEFDVDGQLNIYGTLNTFGYIKGTGNVDALSGASVKVPFVVKDYRGGTNTVTVAYKNKQNSLICPFNLYEMPNVQPETYTIRYGAKISGFASLYASNAHNATTAVIVSTVADDNAALIKLSENAKIEKKFDSVSHKSYLKIFGNVKDGELSLTISKNSVSSKSFLLPISYQYDIVLAKGATADLSMRYKWMPGSSLTVEEGAVMNLNEGSEMIGYEEYTVTLNQKGYNGVFKATEYNVFYTENMPAALKINGILNLNGNGKFGGLLSGSGTVNVGADAGCSTSSKEGNSGDTSVTNVFFGSGNFYTVYETTQTARGTVNGALVEFQPGNTYILS